MFKLSGACMHAFVAVLPCFFATVECRAQFDRFVGFEPSLKSIPVPSPTTLNDYIADRDAAIRLGKALFWDVRLGSDGRTACATCHHQAGADARTTNTMHPGADGVFAGGVSPGAQAPAAIFPTTRFADPANRFSALLASVDDKAGSGGVLREAFVGLHSGADGNIDEDRSPMREPVFAADGVSFRQVTARNAPSVVNAVFNVRQFWDGRANAWFNGVNPFGPVDADARVWRLDPATGSPGLVAVRIDHASLASQAVGPVNNSVEMAAHGRGWIDVARKLLPTRALAAQRVSPSDSVLGAHAAIGDGLTLRYDEMIAAAFRPEWRAPSEVAPGLSMLEANMPLFFGLAVQLYESTLVSDDTRYDRWIEQDGPLGGAPGVLTEQELRGLRLWFNVDPALPQTNCRVCHLSTLFSVATYAGKVGGGGGQIGGGAFPGAPDTDGDGYPDIIDEFPLDPTEWFDNDHDGVGDNADRDDDNDGLPDIIDPFPFDPLNIPEIEVPNPTAALAPQPIAYMPDLAGMHARTMIFQEPPLEHEPAIRPLDFPLTGDGIRVFDPAGRLVVHAPIPPRHAIPCDDVHGLTFRTPQLGSNAALLVDLRAVACRLTLTISLLNFPLGAYRVEIDGVDRGSLVASPLVMYDEGFYNIGVRPTGEDLGVGGTHPNGTPLAAARRLQVQSFLPEFGQLWDGGGLQARVDGAFKTPGLRNVALTGPYFHNGGVSTLEDVIRFYNRGGDFHESNQVDIAPAMLAMDLDESHIADLAAFLRALTDERVQDERPPFDHPALPIAEGGQIAAIGAEGRAASCAPPLRSFADNLLIVDQWAGDCDRNGLLDACELERFSLRVDRNRNGLLDACEAPSCPADVNGDRTVTGDDLALLLASWWRVTDGPLDIDGSGMVDGGDLAILLGSWGACR
jgi:cytochrome c peroxidase